MCGIAVLVLASSASARVWSRETREAAALGHHHPDRGQWCHYPEHDFKAWCVWAKDEGCDGGEGVCCDQGGCACEVGSWSLVTDP